MSRRNGAKKQRQMIEGLTSEVRELKNMFAVKLNFNTERLQPNQYIITVQILNRDLK